MIINKNYMVILYILSTNAFDKLLRNSALYSILIVPTYHLCTDGISKFVPDSNKFF